MILIRSVSKCEVTNKPRKGKKGANKYLKWLIRQIRQTIQENKTDLGEIERRKRYCAIFKFILNINEQEKKRIHESFLMDI